MAAIPRDVRPELTPRQERALRAIYALQLAAALVAFGCTFAVWWRGPVAFTLWELLSRTLAQLEARSPDLLGQPLITLWLLLPAAGVGVLRGMAGALVAPVGYFRLAIAAVLAAVFALAHFYVAFGRGAPADSALAEGAVRPGYGLAVAANGLLALLVAAELLARPRRRRFEPRERVHGLVDDLERLRRGDFRACPHCGAANEPAARRCGRCTMLLFTPSEIDPDPR